MKYIISILFLLILLIPIYEVFAPEENETQDKWWKLVFIWEDFITMLFYTVLALGWFLNLVKHNKLLRILLIVFAIVNLIGTFLATSVPSQDLVYLPGTGIYLIVCLLILFYLIRIEKR